jgi:GntR family transcriptional regulator/MocR family aminotransferase
MPPLASLPHSELVIHVGSLSKVFAPGIRLGYIVAAPTSFNPLLKIFID